MARVTMKENWIEDEASKQHLCSYSVILLLLNVIWKPEPAIDTVFSQARFGFVWYPKKTSNLPL